MAIASLSRMFEFVEKEVRSKRTLEQSMQRVIEKCEKGRPHKDWNELREISFSSELFGKKVKMWFRNRKLKAEIKGLWFSIFCPSNGRYPIADLRLTGAGSFKADKNDNSWACDRTWQPESRLYSLALESIYKIAYRKNGLGNDAEYPLCLAYASLALRDVFQHYEPSVFLRNSKSIGVATGFDDGDFIVIGKLTESGFSVMR